MQQALSTVKRWLVPLLAAMVLLAQGVTAAPLRVAVASNFVQVARALAKDFEQHTGQDVQLVVGSTGRHFAQIRHGAPFDLFLAADSRRPLRLEQEGEAVPGTRFTYALGQVVLWSPQPALVDSQGDVLRSGRFQHLSIANPRLAPYGRAARQVLQSLGLWARLGNRLVRGENVGQAYQFVKSGAAELGFVALSQVPDADGTGGSIWRVPQHLYAPIEQQAVQLSRHPAAAEFLSFLRGDSARDVIRASGYGLP